MTLDRDALRAGLPDPLAVLAIAKRLGYVRGQYRNGLQVIATPDGDDTISAPQYTMRQCDAFCKAWERLPLIKLNR